MNIKQVACSIALLICGYFSLAQEVPLAEHPRPDFERPDWQNLNGIWAFEFDKDNIGVQEKWYEGKKQFSKKIMVPFPWGSKLSGLEDEADYGWYQKEIQLDDAWKGKRIFLTIGASDWWTTIWLDGQKLGEHQGGYTPFSFELTNFAKYGQKQQLIIRVDDQRREFTLYGKQGYGNARGIWQTTYLEARGQEFLEAVHFTPDIDNKKVSVTAYLLEPASKEQTLNVSLKNAGISGTGTFKEGTKKLSFDLLIPNPKLWSLESPYLYEVEMQLGADRVKSYFGMRKISVVDMPGTKYPYIALNNEPVYLQLALDQSYHPDGYYTCPSDAFMREEIERSKAIGLNGIRTHIKVDIPRKLYWADKLGLLVMSDLPNSWGEPDEAMQVESEYTLREMIKRDYNHPSIFSWITFNETWGLVTKVTVDGKEKREYLPATQHWVASMYYLAKSLDPTRLVEDNSICCGRGHTETDIYSWHEYLPGWAWEDHLKNIVQNNYEGSTFHFEKDFKQGRQPNINSECGNVWGYEGSTGDVDWSWDYHRMINTFRKYPQIAGWLYTEHHDVINEWNGYWRFDRSEKETGLSELVPDMSVKDFHTPLYISTGNEIAYTVKGGEKKEIPLFASFMTGDPSIGPELTLEFELSGVNAFGDAKTWWKEVRKMEYKPWLQGQLEPVVVALPEERAVAILSILLKDQTGKVFHRNFVSFDIESGENKGGEILAVKPDQFSNSNWTLKQWNVLDGLKVNGAGKGYFEYEISIPNDLNINKVKQIYFLAEVGAKELFVKDVQEGMNASVSYMLGEKVAPSRNPNAYPMTDEIMHPGKVSVKVGGKTLATIDLPDDPADHRGILSWHYQLKDRKLREAGSYGYRIKVNVPKSELKKAMKSGKLMVRLESPTDGGLAVYSEKFGRFPFNPSVVVRY